MINFDFWRFGCLAIQIITKSILGWEIWCTEAVVLLNTFSFEVVMTATLLIR